AAPGSRHPQIVAPPAILDAAKRAKVAHDLIKRHIKPFDQQTPVLEIELPFSVGSSSVAAGPITKNNARRDAGGTAASMPGVRVRASMKRRRASREFLYGFNHRVSLGFR